MLHLNIDINRLSSVVPGQADAEKAVVLNSQSNIEGLNNVTSTGNIKSATLETGNSTFTGKATIGVDNKTFDPSDNGILINSKVLVELKYIQIMLQQQVQLLKIQIFTCLKLQD